MDAGFSSPVELTPLRQRRGWMFAALIVGLFLPILGTVALEHLFPDWHLTSLPLHSTCEVTGAAIGLTLALMILFSHHRICTPRRIGIVCALISMGVFDIAHSCVHPGHTFVWLHSIANLSGGIFLMCAWLPEKEVARKKAMLIALLVLAASVLISFASTLPSWVPSMTTPEGGFSTVASMINLSGGVLTLLAGLAFIRRFLRERDMEDLVFLFLCTLFGSSGLLFHYSQLWDAGWWFWHGLRLGGYLLPFWLVIFFYRYEEEKVLENQTDLALAISKGDFSQDVLPRHDRDMLGAALHEMSVSLVKNRKTVEEMDWLKTSMIQMEEVLRGDPDAETLASRVITEIATRIEAPVGAFYIADEEGRSFSLFGTYAFSARKNLSNRFKVGEGLVGQAARERKQILLSHVPESYLSITSQLGHCTPRFICVTPFLHEGRVKGVIEIGLLQELNPLQLEYLSKAGEALGLALESAHDRSRLAESLRESQSLTEELQTQQEELRTANEELEEQTEKLKQSEEELKNQQEELQTTNEELEEKTEHLEVQKRDLINATVELERKAGELARSSKYKSEFLANMSHELRTPLNSLLILAGSLAENEKGNLNEHQVEMAEVILGSGKSLLSLINEILDLSKIEAGQMDLHLEPVTVQKLATETERGFKHVFDEKEIGFDIVIEETAPTLITSDAKRIGQILKNLISNAGKFTEKGGVTVTFSAGDLHGSPCLTCAVKDTGPGISEDKQQLIFEAFQQADGSTARKYGGTGLGLSISKELARILGGEIRMESEVGKGSVFSVSLPLNLVEEAGQQPMEVLSGPKAPRSTPPSDQTLPSFGSVEDDRNEVTEQENYILIIEDDASFAKVLLQHCHDKGLKGLVASSGEEGLHLVEKIRPGGVILDLNLPGINGWSVLDQLKNNVKTRHIPVHIMSAEDPSQDALSTGAIGFMRKPVEKPELDKAFDRMEDVLERKMKDLLVIEDDEVLRKAVLELIGNGDVQSRGVGTGQEALELLRAGKYDCVILDLSLPDMTGFELLERAGEDEEITLPPVIVYTGKELTREEEARLVKYSESIIVKGVRSRERLFDEASLFLHRMVGNMPEKKQKMITNLHGSDHMFQDKTVLIVDDDMRNLFALSSALSTKGITTVKAQDGQKALEALNSHPEIDLVLMDIMMPVMDGYETMTRIRSEKRFDALPVIALTAKAMKDDKRKCIEAGANDYLSKPIDLDRLFSMMRVWMYR